MYIHQLIRADIDSGPFYIVSLEAQYVTSFPVTVAGKRFDLKIGGIIDRIDNHEDRTRIIDYKTGVVKNAFTSMESLFNAGDKLRNDAVFQVLLYAYVYYKLYPKNTIVPGLCFVRGSHKEDFSYAIHFGHKKDILNNFAVVGKEFEALLHLHLARLFDTREPFTQTTNLQICRYCPYAAICRREASNE
jgi:hypothetical protein